jgi:hypothetical protein
LNESKKVAEVEKPSAASLEPIQEQILKRKNRKVPKTTPS